MGSAGFIQDRRRSLPDPEYRGPVQLARTKNLSEVMFAELETILYGERDDAIYQIGRAHV